MINGLHELIPFQSAYTVIPAVKINDKDIA